MKTIEKLAHYKQALSKWVADKLDGHIYSCPKPEAYGLTNQLERFMAKKAEDEILNKK